MALDSMDRHPYTGGEVGGWAADTHTETTMTMTRTYYRIQDADSDTAGLVDPERTQVSRSWEEVRHVCGECRGEGRTPTMDGWDVCGECRGKGEWWDYDERPGVSACPSLYDLAEYMLPRADLDGVVLVELRGEYAGEDLDTAAEHDCCLIWPSEVVSVRPITAEELDAMAQ